MTQRLAHIAEAARYGYACVYAVRIEGIPTIFVERDLEGTAPEGYTVDGSLVVDDSASLGAEIDRREGVGRALPFTLGLLDTATVRGYFRRPAYVARLIADVDVDDTPQIYVEHLFRGTSPLASSGLVYVGNETMTYESQLTNSIGQALSTITRDIYGRRYAHRAGSVSAIAADGPISFRGRLVELFAVPVTPSGVVDQDADGDLLSRAAAVWVGHVAARPRRDGAIWSVECTSLDRRLTEEVVSGITASGGFQSSADSWVLVYDPEVVYVVSLQIPGTASLTHFIQPFASLTAQERVRVSTLRRLLSEAWETVIVGSADNDFGIGSLVWRYSGSETAWIGTFAWIPPSGGPHDLRGYFRLPLEEETAFNSPLPQYWKAEYAVYDGAAHSKLYQPGIELALTLEGAKKGVVADYWGSLAGVAGTGVIGVDNAFSGDEYIVDSQLRGRSNVVAGTFVGQVDRGDPGDLPAAGSVIIRTEGGDLRRKYAELEVTTDGALQLELDVDSLPVQPEGKVTLVFAFEDSGPMHTTSRRMLVSTGLDLNGDYDTLPRGAGYGLAERLVDLPSFVAALDGMFADISLDLSIEDAASFTSIYGGILALSQRGVVLRAAADGSAVKLTAVRTGLSEGELVSGVVSRETLAISPTGGVSPVRGRDTMVAPNIVVTKVPTLGSDNEGTITITDESAVEAEGAERWSLTLRGISRTTAVGPVEAWALALFALGKTGQAVEVDVVPWLDVEVGDSIWIDLPEHPGVWDYSAGAPGYVGPARVLGVRRVLATGQTTLSLLLSGVFTTYQLSPSIQVDTFDGTATAPTAIYCDASYLPVLSRYLETDASFDLVPDNPGFAQLTVRYTISAVALVGGACKLTVSAVSGTITLVASAGWRLNLPPSAEAVPEMLEYLHTDSDGVWS